MKTILRSACLLFFLFSLFTEGFMGLVSASYSDNYNYNYNYSLFLKDPKTWGAVKNLPEGDYPVWGYINRSYNFSIVYNCSGNLSTTTMVFYWNCPKYANDTAGNASDYTYFLLNNTSHWVNASDTSYGENRNIDKPEKWYCPNTWNNPGNYSVAVGIFETDKPENFTPKAVSYWIPIKITNETDIMIKSFYKLDENGFEIDNNTYHYFSLSNSSKNSVNNSGEYCAYVKNDYSFSVTHSAISNSPDDNQTIDETTTVVYWDDNTPPDTDVLDITTANCSGDQTKTITWNKNFTHRWSETGEKNINATAFHWDPFDWSERYSKNENCSILIIRDPKNFFLFDQERTGSFFLKLVFSLIGIFSNLHNWGVFLIAAGLMILFFTFTKNNIPVKIAILGLKPFYLKSVDFFIGIFSFVAGMYLYFVFSRCPWDIPIIGGLPVLPDAYFSMLHYEYHTTNAIPYLSILLCLVVIFSLSAILYRIGIPSLSGDSKSGNFLSQKAVYTLRSSISRLSLRFKELHIQIKENIQKINLNDRKVT